MLTPHCSAASGVVAPRSSGPTTRLRRSSEYGFAIHAGLLPAGSLNHIRHPMGIPRFSLFGKRSSARPANPPLGKLEKRTINLLTNTPRSVVVVVSAAEPRRHALAHHNHDRLCAGLDGSILDEVFDDLLDVIEQFAFPFAK